MRLRSNRFSLIFLLAIGGAFAALLSLRFGVRPLDWANVLQALTQFDTSVTEQLIVRELRVPRAMAAILAGGALGLAGALMQVMSRNPLADPGLLGVNGGAALGVVIGIWAMGITAPSGLIVPALIGAGLAAVMVFVLGGGASKRGPDPARLVLAGAAVAALFLALTWSILILSKESLDTFRFWVLGSFANVTMADVGAVAPAFAVSLVLAGLAAVLMDTLVLGDEAARSLGVRVGLARTVTVVAIVGLCGTAVSLAGPIAFVGLIVPHAVRPFLRSDVRLLAVASFFGGALLALLADIAGRLILPGREIEAGAMMALIGGPALVLIVKLRAGGWR